LDTARVYERQGEIYYYSSDVAITLNAGLRTLNLAEAAGDSPELARAYGNMCIAASLAPWPALAETYSRHAQAVVERVDDLPSRLWVVFVSNLYTVSRGEWEKAQQAFEEAVAIADRLGDRRRWESFNAALAAEVYRLGQFARGVKIWADVTASAHERNDVQYQAWGLGGEAESLLRLGRADEAVAALDKALPFLAASMDRSQEIIHYGVLAVGYLRQGKLELAGEAARRSAKLIAQLSPTGYALIDGYAGTTEVCLALWEANADPAWAKLSRQSCRALHGYARIFPIGQPSAWLWQGVCDWLSGHTAQAHRSWQKSLEAAQRLRMLYDEGLAHYQIGRHLKTSDPPRGKHLDRASEIFAQLEAAYDLERVKRTVDGGR